jgi:hypothetical protein
LLILVSSQKIETSRTAITNSKNWRTIFTPLDQKVQNVKVIPLPTGRVRTNVPRREFLASDSITTNAAILPIPLPIITISEQGVNKGYVTKHPEEFGELPKPDEALVDQ